MKLSQYYTYLLLFLVVGHLGFAQQQSLPIGFSDDEKALVRNFQFKTSGLADAPTGNVRAAAEWEEVEYLVLSWDGAFKNILQQVVAASVKECKVVIVAKNKSSVESFLSSKGIDMNKVTVINRNTDSIWIRDFGGNTIYSNDVGDRALTDWIYNRPRRNDDKVPSAHSKQLNIPIYETNIGKDDLVNTGGNYMSDGLGNAFASELILEENQAGNPYNVSVKNEAQIDDIMKRYMGIKNYIKMTVLPYDEIHHIDMHMKLLDEETLLVSQYPNGVADGPQIEKNLKYVLDNFKSPFGTPYRVFRVNSPKDRRGSYPDKRGSYCTYANATFVNKSILIPVYRPEVDKPALDVYRKLMPGYNIVGIDVDESGEDLIARGGAIHCITHTIGVANPLWIVHQPVRESVAKQEISLSAMIKHNSGVKSAKVLWRKKGDNEFKASNMTSKGNDNWEASLPVEASGYNVEYYIEATANSGKTLARPIVAPKGFWTIEASTLSINTWAEKHISKPFPNPTTEQVTFSLNHVSGDVNVSIYNTLGQQLYNKDLDSGNGTITLKLKQNWSGLLNVVFKGEFGEVNRKIIKI